jgi:hypothetical protein
LLELILKCIILKVFFFLESIEVISNRIKQKYLDTILAPTEIVEGLYIGTSLAARNKDALNERAISHILSIDDAKKPFLGKLSYKTLIMKDDTEENIIELIPIANKFIEEALRNGGKVLVCWYV